MRNHIAAQKQQGVALMIVILVFALVSILAVGMYNRQGLFLKQAGNVNAHTQAYHYGLAAETLAMRLLKDDWESDKEDGFVDDLEQVEKAGVSPFTEVAIEGQYNDVHGKLNINDLVKLDGTLNEVTFKRFERLLDRLALESVKLQPLIDWVDPDDDNSEPNSLDGAEDGEYTGLDVPYRSGNQPFNHITELRLLFGIEDEDYEKLIEYVTVLPRGKGHINVNTASAEILQALSGISDQKADELVSAREARDKSRWESLEEFNAEEALSGSELKQDNLQVYSLFFESASRITLGDRVVRLTSLIYRAQEDGAMTVISRDQGKKFVITKEQEFFQ